MDKAEFVKVLSETANNGIILSAYQKQELLKLFESQETKIKSQEIQIEYAYNMENMKQKIIKKNNKYIKKLQIENRKLKKQLKKNADIVYCKDCEKRGTFLCVMDDIFESKDTDYCSEGKRRERGEEEHGKS